MKFRQKIERAINQHSMENGSNTPDLILAKYLVDCLAAFDKATNARERWYGRSNRGPGCLDAQNRAEFGVGLTPRLAE